MNKKYELLKNKFTDKQWEILEMSNPYGPNMSIKEICSRLGISRTAIQKRIRGINKVCPDAWYTIRCIKHAMSKDRARCRKMDGYGECLGSVQTPFSLEHEYSDGSTRLEIEGMYLKRGKHGVIFDPFKEVF